MSDNRKIADMVLQEASRAVMSERGNQHGDAEDSFQMIADLWNIWLRHKAWSKFKVYLDLNITPGDVAQMMSLLKKVRHLYGDPKNPDNFIDDVGYSSLAAMMALAEAEPDAHLRVDDLAPSQTAADTARADLRAPQPGTPMLDPNPVVPPNIADALRKIRGDEDDGAREVVNNLPMGADENE